MPTAKLLLKSSLALIVGAAVAASLATQGTAVAADPIAINVVPLTVRTPISGFDRMIVSVTVCHPGTDHFVTIDDIMVDTGSTRQRLQSSAVLVELDLPPFTAADGKPLAECLRFVHDDAWRPLSRTDMWIGGLAAKSLPIQIVADDLRPRPAGCPNSTARPTSGGTLVIGPHVFDCLEHFPSRMAREQGSSTLIKSNVIRPTDFGWSDVALGVCMQDENRPGVFVNDDGSWQPFRGAVPDGARLPNPVTLFSPHGNGVVFDLPASAANGTREIVDTLTFGVATSTNNSIGGTKILQLNSNGLFTTRYDGDLPESYTDSGTETYILANDGLARCAGMSWSFCVSAAQTLSATIVGTDGLKIPVPFTVGDYRGALDRRAGAWDGFADVAEASSNAFVWGAPFFLRRRVALVFDGMVTVDTQGMVGPFYALP